LATPLKISTIAQPLEISFRLSCMILMQIFFLFFKSLKIQAHSCFVSGGRQFFGNSVAFGAMFFVISDLILAINKFCFSIPGAKFLNMSSYYTGQFFIAKSALQK